MAIYSVVLLFNTVYLKGVHSLYEKNKTETK